MCSQTNILSQCLANPNKSRIFAPTEPATLPEVQRTRAGRFFIRKCFNNAKDKTPVPMSVPPRLFRCSGHRGGFLCCFNVYLNPNYLKKM